MELIELNVPVVRDAEGYWSNPGIPDFCEDWTAFSAWLEAQGIEWKIVDLEGYDEHPAYNRYFMDDDPNISDWTPAPPAGDGWHTFSIHMTEDSVVWVWARRPGAPA